MKILTLFFVLFGFSSLAQTAEEIINKHIAAIGGKENLDAITTYKFEAYNGSNITYYKKPDKWRIEYLEDGKLSGYSIYLGEKGWSVSEANEVDIAFGSTNAIYDFLPDYLSVAKAPSCKIEYLGTDEKTGMHTIGIKPLVNNSFGYYYTFYIDPATWVIRKIREDSDGYTYNYYYEDFTTINGLKIPMKMVREDGYTAEKRSDTRTNVQINIPLDDKLFEKPVSAKKVLKAFEGENKKWGFRDLDQNVVIKPVYDNTWEFNNGYAKVEQAEKFGFIDSSGKVVIALKYEDVNFFEEGLASAKLNGKWGFIDRTGKEIIPFTYDKVRDFKQGVSAVSQNGKSGFIDKTGKQVIALKYEDAWNFSDGIASVKLNGKWGMIDKTEKVVVDFKYESSPSPFKEGYTYVKREGKWGRIDKTGKEIIPCMYENIESANDGMIKVLLNKKWGVVDINNKNIIPFEYDAMWNFSEGLLPVNKGMVNYTGGKWGFLDKTGKIVIPLQYDKVVSKFENGRARVSLSGSTITIDKTGKELK